MKPYIFNPFGIFDKEWGHRILPWIMIIILAFLFIISIFDPIFPVIHNFAQDRHIYMIGMLTFLLTSAPLIFYWLSKLTSPSQEEHIQLRNTEEDAINSILVPTKGHHIGNVDICCYTGPTFLAVLSNQSFPKDTFSKVRILIRHPGASFRIPSDVERAQAMRQRIITNINLYQQLLEPSSDNIEIRGYSCEPSLRSMVVNAKRGFFTFYTTSHRVTSGRMTPDYVSRGKPVCEFSTNNPVGISIMNTVQSRFEDIWKISCPILPKPTLLFDFDGTLYNSIECHKKAWNIVLSEIGINESDYRFSKVQDCVEMGFSAPEIFQFISIGNIDKAQLIKRKRIVYEEIITSEKCQLHSDVISTITQLHERNYQLAIVTFSSKSHVENILEQFLIKNYFSAIVCREDAEGVKAESNILSKHDVLLRVFESLNIQPSNTVLIGDSIADHNAAINAGTCFIAILRNYKIDRSKLGLIIRPFETIVSIKDLLSLFF